VSGTVALGNPMFLKAREYGASRRNLVFNGLRQPAPSFLCILLHSAPKGVHDSEHVHRLSVPGFGQAPKTIRGFHVPAHRLRRFRSTALGVKAPESILRKGIALFG
jgi:hypothetical protein